MRDSHPGWHRRSFGYGLRFALTALSSMPKDSSSRVKHSEPWNPVPPDEVLFGKTAGMAALRMHVERISRTNIPILLTGEGGTGKEALARWVHANSDYASGEFVKVNCAAIPGALLESELFGYEKGAFTGANFAKPGRVELAHRGSLFLDEIADLDLHLQSKLLHFLQDGTFSRIGGGVERKIDARLLSATDKDLEKETREGRFREDLFYRIHVFRLKLPPLRERLEDIPKLAEFFRQNFQKQFGMPARPIPPETFEYLQNLAWPGNVRELSNMMARYVLIGPEAAASAENFPKQNRSSVGHGANRTALPLKKLAKDAMKQLERNVILETLRANQWNRRKTAQELKISYRALIYKIRDAGLISRRRAGKNSRAAENVPLQTPGKD
jgi:two-component system, NtrC family, response regulator AtoC